MELKEGSTFGFEPLLRETVTQITVRTKNSKLRCNKNKVAKTQGRLDQSNTKMQHAIKKQLSKPAYGWITVA